VYLGVVADVNKPWVFRVFISFVLVLFFLWWLSVHQGKCISLNTARKKPEKSQKLISNTEDGFSAKEKPTPST